MIQGADGWRGLAKVPECHPLGMGMACFRLLVQRIASWLSDRKKCHDVVSTLNNALAIKIKLRAFFYHHIVDIAITTLIFYQLSVFFIGFLGGGLEYTTQSLAL